MSEQTYDYGEHAEKPARAEAFIDEITAAVERLQELEQEKAEADLESKVAAAKIKKILEEELPELLLPLGKDAEVTLPRFGIKLKRKVRVKASISEANMDRAHDWLEKRGDGGMIKRLVAVQFNKDQEEPAQKLAEKLRGEYPAVETKRTVHAGTLSKWARERLEEGVAITDAITVYKQPVVEIK